MMAWVRGLILVFLCSVVVGCGDDDDGSSGEGGVPTGRRDAGDDPERDSGDGPTKPPSKPDAGKPKPDAGKPMDAGTDAKIDNPFEYDASGDYADAKTGLDPAPPRPDTWSCAPALWADGVCDCGCSARDFDCVAVSCSEPGCIAQGCGACFSATGVWKPCAPDPVFTAADWKCDPAKKDQLLNDSVCDCGCGIPDPTCKGNGCTTPGCRVDACDIRHGCGGATTDAADTCAYSLPAKWKCPWGKYGSGDGCDCGCGMIDPDCNGQGCADALCANTMCSTCHDGSGRPYACEAVEAGWSEGAGDGSYCSAVHYGTGDGCDCGCGGPDPDCGNAGCEEPGCSDAACKRCTNDNGRTTGCAPLDWTCDARNYGTGDGCDCGCGFPDPDCSGGGLDGSTDESFTAACDVCHGTGTGSLNGYMKCPGWTCTDDMAWENAECDCGCGKVDPFCRADDRLSCTAPGCVSPVCDHCNDAAGNRTSCGGTWTAAVPSTCNRSYYGLDGLCDCGCAAIDPDCAENKGCAAPGCVAEDCDVCHAAIGGGMRACTQWTCEAAGYGSDDGCDCGCGLEDPDCAGEGCTTPGCHEQACETCHDPYGRPGKCP